MACYVHRHISQVRTLSPRAHDATKTTTADDALLASLLDEGNCIVIIDVINFAFDVFVRFFFAAEFFDALIFRVSFLVVGAEGSVRGPDVLGTVSSAQ